MRWPDVVRVALLALLALVAQPAFAQTFPAFTGLVVDAANILPADAKISLETKLEALQQQTGRQLVVATIPDLQGYPLEDYGYRLGRSWGVGLKDADNGAILFIAPNEQPGHRGPRIEVGRRLEPVITDAYSSVLINTQMMPRLRAGDVVGALNAGTDALIAQLRLPDAEARARADEAAKAFDRTHRRSGGQDGGVPVGFVIVGLVLAFMLLSGFRRHGGARTRGYRHDGGSNWPIVLWSVAEAMSHQRHGGGGGWGSFGGGDGGGGSDGSWGGGGFTGGGGGDFGGGGASGSW